MRLLTPKKVEMVNDMQRSREKETTIDMSLEVHIINIHYLSSTHPTSNYHKYICEGFKGGLGYVDDVGQDIQDGGMECIF